MSDLKMKGTKAIGPEDWRCPECGKIVPKNETVCACKIKRTLK